MNVLIHGMWGLGDNIYQRPFIRELAKSHNVYLGTPWPEIYEDLPIKFYREMRNLRTQLKNLQRQPKSVWSMPRRPIREMRIGYKLTNSSVIADFKSVFNMPTFSPELDLPATIQPKHIRERPIAMIRPLTVRMEWHNRARNPLPEYIEQIAELLMKTHCVINAADISAPHETLVGKLPPSHESYVKGELTIRELLSLAASSDIIVGGVGWIVPAAVALNKRAFVILGGHGSHNHPKVILASHWRHRIGFGWPDDYCLCANMRHECNKTISNLTEQFQRYLDTPNQPA